MSNLEEPFSDLNRNFKEQNFFIENLRGSEMHWYFVQALQAMQGNLYIPACLSFLNGIEASLRITMAQLNNSTETQELERSTILSNGLLNTAKEKGMPVELLAFTGETDYFEKLASTKPTKESVELVRVRNNMCHGNLLEYVNSDLGADNRFFTPECLRDISNVLRSVSEKWVGGLGKYRQTHLFKKPI